MLRRLALAATVSAVALATATPLAGAIPLPPPGGPEQARDQLTLVVSESGNARTDGRYELSCGPVGGTHPDREAACARLDELAWAGEDPFMPVPQGTMCTQQAGGPAAARITGSWRGRPVDAVFSRTDGCEISRWQRLEPILPSTRS
ncbi:SSI family serine proteinase inhibitor [Streptomyces yaizuensis]|uniref:Subtilase-type protease inhibitor n=1 Tax=Streptomyces yaizuensis TaxID=2989713 RepID=A0ABQ5NZL8_9ACTN|nr:SSI family serine proteinase inhibitor [Streptomyces sp. YSPA8]GLF95802.1 subtilase-type protease inhibitor [Streptomyces sp. YSPA8]